MELQNDLGEYALMKVREQGNGGEGAKPLVKALTRESLGESVTSRGDDVIFTMSKLPIIMMVIAVLAVLNTVLASVQSRRREFGLMRAVGVPGGMVMRMLWAETLMVSLCAVVMSLALGVLGAGAPSRFWNTAITSASLLLLSQCPGRIWPVLCFWCLPSHPWRAFCLRGA